ncbi:MAG TPA: fused MFS/spermidine synthase, partial [Polyangiaceae bacterium]|nr:fused MFS/spermidine synthase [Polyangiaceae bacterium]
LRHPPETRGGQDWGIQMSNATLVTSLSAEPTRTRDWLALNFALTVFVSAFLLFQIEPLISKFILPWFGGSPAVWTTCLLFFQVVLFCGYAYAHLSTRFLAPRERVIVHCTILAVSLALLHVAPGNQYKPLDAAQPTILILRLLSATVGLPYFALSSTGPLLQAWFSAAYPTRSPYRLYALSNLGSLIALLSYPFVFEPAFDVLTQAHLWSWLFAGFALLCAVCALKAFPALREARLASPNSDSAARRERTTWLERTRWIALPACASLALLATTNHVTSDVAVIPFLWVVPLSLYLVSFIVAFDHERWYRRRVFAALTVLLCLAVGCLDPLRDLLEKLQYDFTFVDDLVLHFAALFCVCMVCHGELVRARPNPSRLTEFYLSISAGGALGGVFVSLIAPAIFSTFFEWTLALLASFALGVGVLYGKHAWRRWGVAGAAGVGAFTLAGLAGIFYYQWDTDAPLDVRRNFYGVVSVYEADRDDPAMHHFSLAHGIVVHGRQFVSAEKKGQPVAYYAPGTGVGQALRYFQKEPDLRVGVVGLGVGTVAAYVGAGQSIRFYEINDQVEALAEKYFSFLRDSPGQTKIVLGDARLSLEREPNQNFHVFVLDAFSGDAVPAHLLTKEAFAIFVRHLRPDGVIAVNITNRHLDLAPVVAAAAQEYHLQTVRIFSEPDAKELAYRADWLLLTKNAAFVAAVKPAPNPEARSSAALLWTDHYSNLFQILE